MPRGKSAISTRTDDSEMGVDASEIAKLLRQFRIMDGDRQSYSIQARKQIRKQEQEIEKLMKEQEELRCKLGVCKSLSRQQQDQEEAQELRTLLDQIQLIEEDFEKERAGQRQLEQELSIIESKLDELRRREVSRGDKLKTEVRKSQKAIRTLENKLDRALARFSEQLTKNRQLREELQLLHIERVRFQQLYKRLDKELQEVRKKIGEIIYQSTAAYDTRVEAQTKMSLMKEKTVKDLAQYNTEMKELERLISHDQNYKSFMTTKCNDRPIDGDHKQVSDVKEARRMDSLGEESLETLEEVFERIQKVTGEDDLEVMVAKFLQVEDRNFALFNFVNEQNKEAEVLREQINQIKEEMEQFRVEGLFQEENHGLLVKEIDNQQKDILSQAEECETQADGVSKTLDLVKTAVSNIFVQLECDQSMIEDILGSSTEINDNNIMSYLRLIEQKTNEMLTVRAYLQSKDLEKDYSPKDLAKFLLGQNPVILEDVDAAQTTINSVNYNTEELNITENEERPLSKGELRRRIINEVMQKDISPGQMARKNSKTSLQSSSRQRSLEDP
ncbi:coiled-coil domain-containing protein 114 isoform X2 [Eucyclogobius newberryi]|uniref:coiled-coil domain-containing protein 114 isoform X2 n=1 Tax=Eucyclogobius newberryi TaxID=166745 RepID=UPI003B5BB360